MLHGQDGDSLKTGFNPNGRATRFALIGSRGTDGVPLLHKLASRHAGSGNVDESNIVILVFLLLLLHIFIDVNRDAMEKWKAIKFKMFPPEKIVCFGLAGCTSEEGIIKAQFTEIFLFRGKVLGFNNP